jgi:dATP pyrophosphohydrolase
MPEIRGGVFEVCIFKQGKQGPLYLLLQRAETDSLYPGIWQVITGSLARGEHTVRGALREIREETSLEVENLWVVPHVNTFYVARNDSVYVSPFFAARVAADAEPLLSEEHQAYLWVSYDETQRLIPWPGQRTGLEMVHRFVASEQEAGRLLRVPLGNYDERRPS